MAEFCEIGVHLSRDAGEELMVSSDLERFLHNVNLNGMHVLGMVLPCWEWKGCVDATERPRFYLNKRGELARRALLEILLGQELPNDCAVAVICGNKLCVRPEHLVACNDVDAGALGPRGSLDPGYMALLRKLHGNGYDAPELAYMHEVSVPLIEAILREGGGV